MDLIMVTKYLRPSTSEMKFHLGPQTQEVIPHGHKALLFLGQFVKNAVEQTWASLGGRERENDRKEPRKNAFQSSTPMISFLNLIPTS